MATPDLAGLLSARPKNAPAQVAAPVSVNVRKVQPADRTARMERAPQATQAVQAEKNVRVSERQAGKQYLRSITVYLPRTAHQRVAEEAAARETTRTALILTAVNQTHARLGELTAEQASPVAEQDLFDIPQQRAAAEPAVQTTIRVTDSQLEAIEALAKRHSLNRSHLIVGALRLYLG